MRKQSGEKNVSEAKQKNYYPKTPNATHKHCTSRSEQKKYICNKKKPQANNFFSRCVPFVQLPIKFSYIFCSIWFEHVPTGRGTYFLFIFSLFVSLLRYTSWRCSCFCSFSKFYVKQHRQRRSLCFFLLYSCMNVLNIYFAHFDTIFFSVFRCWTNAIRVGECVAMAFAKMFIEK